MFSWLKRWNDDRDETDPFADNLVELFIRHVELHDVNKQRVVQTAFAYVLGQATGEARKHRWRGGALARLSNRFGWGLVERGYPREFSLTLAKDLAIRLAQKK